MSWAISRCTLASITRFSSPPDKQCRATEVGEGAPIVEIQQRCHQPLEAFRIARFPDEVEQRASEWGEPEVLDEGIVGYKVP